MHADLPRFHFPHGGACGFSAFMKPLVLLRSQHVQILLPLGPVRVIATLPIWNQMSDRDRARIFRSYSGAAKGGRAGVAATQKHALEQILVEFYGDDGFQAYHIAIGRNFCGVFS